MNRIRKPMMIRMSIEIENCSQETEAFLRTVLNDTIDTCKKKGLEGRGYFTWHGWSKD